MSYKVVFTTQNQKKKVRLLVIVDMQNDFIDGSLGSEAAQAIVPRILPIIKHGDYDAVIATKDTHTSDYLQTQEGKLLPVEHCIYETPGWHLNEQIDAAIREHPNGMVICKPTFGSLFLSEFIKNLPPMMDPMGKDCELSIDIVGLCTDICVVSNAMILKAAFPEARIIVFRDCCAGTSQEAHEAALKTMESCQILVISTLK